MSTEPDKARVFRECGNALAAMGRRLSLGKQLVALGRDMRNIANVDLTDENLFKLRRPLDQFRALIDSLAETATELRTLLDTLSSIIGYDGN